MFRHLRIFAITLFAALLIVLGGIGTFTAEAASFQAVINETRTAGPFPPLDPYDATLDSADITLIPGLPY